METDLSGFSAGGKNNGESASSLRFSFHTVLLAVFFARPLLRPVSGKEQNDATPAKRTERNERHRCLCPLKDAYGTYLLPGHPNRRDALLTGFRPIPGALRARVESRAANGAKNQPRSTPDRGRVRTRRPADTGWASRRTGDENNRKRSCGSKRAGKPRSASRPAR